MTIATTVFVFSLIGTATLFALKYWEGKRGNVFVPTVRQKADVQAEKFKELVIAAWFDLGKVPSEAFRTARIIVHEAALGFAALARFSERQAHRLADLVSHKRGFERRETRSEFLRKVSEHKNSNGSGLPEKLDTTL